MIPIIYFIILKAKCSLQMSFEFPWTCNKCLDLLVVWYEIRCIVKIARDEKQILEDSVPLGCYTRVFRCTKNTHTYTRRNCKFIFYSRIVHNLWWQNKIWNFIGLLKTAAGVVHQRFVEKALSYFRYFEYQIFLNQQSAGWLLTTIFIW